MTDCPRPRYDFRGVCADCGQKPENWDEHDGWHRGIADTPSTPRTLPTREQVTEVVGYVLRNSGNYPEAAQAAMVSQDITGLRDVVVDAVLALIDKENTMTDEPTEMGVAFQRAERERAQREDVERASTEASTAPADTIPVPRALIERAATAYVGRDHIEADTAMNALAALLDPPKPPAPRLRIVNLNGMPLDGGVGYWQSWAAEVRAQPDVLAAIDEAIDRFGAGTPGQRTDLKARIRAALGVDS